MSPLSETVYTPGSPLRRPGKLVGSMIRDLRASRGLAWRLFIRDISAMYRQSLLGYAWAFIPPIVTAVGFTFLNSQGIVDAGQTSVPYPAFVMIGTLLWQTFVDALNSPMKAINGARSMLAKINFPHEALLLSGLGEVLFNFMVRALLLVPVYLYYDIPVGRSVLLFPIGLLGLLILGLAIGLLLAPIGILYSDVGRGIGLATGFWMLLSPVVYQPRQTGLGAWLAEWNPVSPMLLLGRDTLTHGSLDPLGAALWITGAALLVAFAGWILQRLTMPILIERMGG